MDASVFADNRGDLGLMHEDLVSPSHHPRSRSCSLTILKASKDTPPIDARKPIYAANGQSLQQGIPAKEAPRRLALSFSRSGPAQSYGTVGLQSLSSSSSNNRLGAAEEDLDPGVTIHLAQSSVLLPFLDRPAEVKDLLFAASSRNTALIDSLRAVLGGEVSPEWPTFMRILVASNRQQLDDTEWLRQLRNMIFPRSPSLWTQLLRCLGGEGIDLRPDADAQVHPSTDPRRDKSWMSHAAPDIKAGDDGCEEDDASSKLDARRRRKSDFDVEALHVLPSTFADSPSSMTSTSMSREADDDGDGNLAAISTGEDDRDAAGNASQERQSGKHRRRRSSSLYQDQESELRDFSTKGFGSFPGVRIVHSSDQSASSSRRASILSSASSSSSAASAAVQFRKHRGLGSLIATRPVLETSENLDEVLSSRRRFLPRRKSIAMPDLVSRGDALMPLSLKMTPAKVEEDKQRHSRHTISYPRGSRHGSIATLAPAWSGAGARPHIRKSVTFSTTNSSSANAAGEGSSDEAEQGTLTPSKEGLLPDGRTRHPSAGSDEISPGRAAFRTSLSQLSPRAEPRKIASAAFASPVDGEDDGDDGEESKMYMSGQRHRSTSTASETYSTGSQAVCSEDGSSIFDENVETPVEGDHGSARNDYSSSTKNGYFLPSSAPAVRSSDADGHTSQADRRQFGTEAAIDAYQDARNAPAESSLSPPQSLLTQLPSPTNAESTYFTRYHPESASTTEGKRRRSDADIFLLSPGGTRQAIVFPVPPSPQVSRSKELCALMDQPEAQATFRDLQSTMGKRKIEELRRLVEKNDRKQLTDVALLERVASDIFGLVDHSRAEESNDAGAKQRAEEALVQDSYPQRWEAFARVCQDVFHLTKHDISEAKKRCGPAVQLSWLTSSP